MREFYISFVVQSITKINYLLHILFIIVNYSKYFNRNELYFYCMTLLNAFINI